MINPHELKQEVQDVPVETFLKTYQAPAPALVNPMTELALVNITDQVIEALGAEAAGLTIAGVEDKEGYDKVHAVEMKIRNIRVKAEKFLKGAREPFIEAQKKYVALEKVILAKFEVIEKPLTLEKKKINDEKARIVAEAAQKERLHSRQQATWAGHWRLPGPGGVHSLPAGPWPRSLCGFPRPSCPRGPWSR